jgi:hypothetical protein
MTATNACMRAYGTYLMQINMILCWKWYFTAVSMHGLCYVYASYQSSAPCTSPLHNQVVGPSLLHAKHVEMTFHVCTGHVKPPWFHAEHENNHARRAHVV